MREGNAIVRAVGEDVKARLRAVRGGRMPQGHSPSLYVMDCFLRALAASPVGRDFVLKGGNLFRVWDPSGSGAFRPTNDIDMQSDLAPGDLREMLRPVVETPAFRERTGLLFDLDGMRVSAISKGFLQATRLEGQVVLGAPDERGRATTLPFCLEATWGPAPEGAVTLSRWRSVLQADPDFELGTSRPEWMIAEKFHSLVSRGVATSRLKDFRDLCVLLPREGVDAAPLRGCADHVFSEFGQERLLPRSADGVPALAPSFADAGREELWQRSRWPEWEGRAFDPEIDPTLLETLAAICHGLEARGLLAPTPAGALARALLDLNHGCDRLLEEAVTPVAAGRFATVLKAVAAARPAASDPSEISWRWRGACRYAGLGATEPGSVMSKLARVVEEQGLAAALDRGWDHGRGGGVAAIAALSASLAAVPAFPVRASGAPAVPARAVPAEPGPRTPPRDAAPVPVPGNPRGAPRARRGGRSPEQERADALRILAVALPGEHLWFGALCRILAHPDVPGGEIPLGVRLEMPTQDRAEAIWSKTAAKHRVDADLWTAVSMAREILGMEPPAPGPRR